MVYNSVVNYIIPVFFNMKSETQDVRIPIQGQTFVRSKNINQP